MHLLAIFVLAGLVLGMLLGSFLNVVIARVPQGESIVRPRSRCLGCGHAIRWNDNVPVLSWLLLRGHCRDCGAMISLQYPAVEIATGLWLAYGAGVAEKSIFAQAPALLTSQLGINLVGLLGVALLGLLLIALIVIDWQTQRLPDALTLTGIAAGLFLICTQTLFLLPGQKQIIFAFKHLRLSSPGSFAARGNVFLTGTEALIFGRIVAICGAALILLVIRWVYKAARKREGLGLGDIKLLAMIAAFLGFWPALLALFVGTLLATLYATVLLVRRRAGAVTRLPFGSFLGVAGLISALFGSEIIAWYSALLR